MDQGTLFDALPRLSTLASAKGSCGAFPDPATAARFSRNFLLDLELGFIFLSVPPTLGDRSGQLCLAYKGQLRIASATSCHAATRFT